VILLEAGEEGLEVGGEVCLDTRDQNHRDVLGARVFAQGDQGAQAAALGHHHVEKHDVGGLLLGQSDALVGVVRGAHLPTCITEHGAEKSCDVGFVVDDHGSLRRHNNLRVDLVLQQNNIG